MSYRLLLSFALIGLIGCGGGGGGGTESSGFLGTFRGTIFLTNNTCSFNVADSAEVTYTINSDSSRTVVEENFPGLLRTYTGPALTGEETTLRVVSQTTEGCVFASSNRPTGETYQELYSLEFTSTDAGDLTLNRQVLSPEACSDPECSVFRVGNLTRVQG